LKPHAGSFRNPAIFAAVVAVILFVSLMMNVALPAYAEDAPSQITFLIEEEVFATVTIVDGHFTVPSDAPEKEGYIFECWSDGLARYLPGNTYTVQGGMTLSAVWKEPPVEAAPKEPFFNTGEKVAFWGMVCLLCVIFMFSYYWFGIKNRSMSQLRARIKKLFSGNKGL